MKIKNVNLVFLGFFTFLAALAHGAPCHKSDLLSKGQLISKGHSILNSLEKIGIDEKVICYHNISN